MRKLINGSALVFFVWLVLDTLRLPEILLNFLLVGALPGTTATVSPTIMLAIMTLVIGIIVFELLARHVGIFRHVRRTLIGLTARRERLPSRRFQRI